jgi:copper oxidase (laccase) domain-containing protein
VVKMDKQRLQSAVTGLHRRYYHCVDHASASLPFSSWVVSCGTIGKPLTSSRADETKDSILNTMSAVLTLPILSMNQVHGSDILEFDLSTIDENDVTGYSPTDSDGLFLLNASQSRFSLGAIIWTADCLPIVILGRHHALLLHAGWRGLANGLIPKALTRFCSTGDSIERVFIGPCADPDRYEVGKDVLDSIAKPVVVYEHEGGSTCGNRAKLNLAASAIDIVIQWTNDFFIARSNTISDSRWYSYRRDPESQGRNVTYLTIAGRDDL